MPRSSLICYVPERTHDLQIRIRPSKTFNGKIVYQLLVGPIDSEMKVKEIEKELGIE
ncbi:MAG: hypothetical protein LBD36_01830 [Holosporales bacterium]|jgi:hypothetical protein|nr:hypothetical protein [Holosporales bacterium]